ncbi:hypothetical protein [Nonomuraea bangladeshensis]|uniref:hypothetical protein n=1 Tax=Nonomuraea bangladeshensis TaxID=404385 RepID=UPI0031DAB96D
MTSMARRLTMLIAAAGVAGATLAAVPAGASASPDSFNDGMGCYAVFDTVYKRFHSLGFNDDYSTRMAEAAFNNCQSAT